MPTSFNRSFTIPPLPSANTFANISNINRIHAWGTFTPLVHAYAGRYNLIKSDNKPCGHVVAYEKHSTRQRNIYTLI